MVQELQKMSFALPLALEEVTITSAFRSLSDEEGEESSDDGAEGDEDLDADEDGLEEESM